MGKLCGRTTLLGIAGLALWGSEPPIPGDWIENLSREAGRIKRDQYSWAGPVVPASEARKTLNTLSADPNTYVFDGVTWRKLDGEEVRQWEEAQKERLKKVGRAQELVRMDKLREARLILVPLVRENGSDELASNALADIALREEHYAEALALLWPTLHRQASQDTIVRGALAGAMTNHGSAEMKVFCDRITIQAAGSLTGLQESIPQTVRSSGLVAMAAWHQMHGDDSSAKVFFERALKLESTNPWVNYSLGNIYSRANDWERAVKAYSLFVSRLVV
ncbi:MAG: tetratricopeptide repeat protein [Fimbriimonadaceae bacterium]|nr:MAG: tetratricopeptide repeat protein [Fimbriimonadaceae bacterium]